jgi:beta-glucosidase
MTIVADNRQDVRERALNRDIQSHPAATVNTPFVWGAGIECSFIPHLNVDQFEWTQHNNFWRDDFARARNDLGLTALRYALPWHQLEPQRGQFDWSLSDERIEECEKIGLELYLDVMHFGAPTWLPQAAGDPEFPEALEQFTYQLVSRYGKTVKTWCPCNEPLVLSLFSGDFGFWPPHSRKWRGYMPVLSRVVQAVSRGIRAIRQVQPDAKVLLCDNVESFRSRDPELAIEVRRRNLRRFLVLDLLLGRFDHQHPLYSWVTAYGLSELDLEWFRHNAQTPDILGLDYYPNSTWRLEQTAGAVRQRRADSAGGIYGAASEYYDRYGLPMMITETSIDGKPINRQIWLDRTIDDCRRLREEGVPMLGYLVAAVRPD